MASRATNTLILLGEELDERSFEVTLDSKRIKRLGSVLLSAGARTTVEKSIQGEG